jgi:hypothetical protein
LFAEVDSALASIQEMVPKTEDFEEEKVYSPFADRDYPDPV